MQRPVNGGRPQAQVNVNDLDPIVCSQCGGKIFVQGAWLYYLSPLQSPTGQEGHAAKPAGFVCAGCGSFNTLSRKKKEESNPFGVSVQGSGTVKQ